MSKKQFFQYFQLIGGDFFLSLQEALDIKKNLVCPSRLKKQLHKRMTYCTKIAFYSCCIL